MYTEENMITTVETIIQLQDLSDKQELLNTFLNYFNFDRLAANIRNQARTVHCFEETSPKSGLTFHPGWTLFPCRAALLLTPVILQAAMKSSQPIIWSFGCWKI